MFAGLNLIVRRTRRVGVQVNCMGGFSLIGVVFTNIYLFFPPLYKEKREAIVILNSINYLKGINNLIAS